MVFCIFKKVFFSRYELVFNALSLSTRHGGDENARLGNYICYLYAKTLVPYVAASLYNPFMILHYHDLEIIGSKIPFDFRFRFLIII